MKVHKTYQKVFICIFPFVLALVLFLAAKFITDNYTMPECPTHRFLNINCPGCGMTRSVIALIHGDILLSLRQNAITVVLIVAFVLFYLEFTLRAFGVNVRFPIHSTKLLYVLLIITGVYSVLRNIIPWLMPV